jgi:hypothetical protein
MKLRRGRLVNWLLVAVTIFVVVLVALIGLGYLVIPGSPAASVTITSTQYRILEGAGGSGCYWFYFPGTGGNSVLTVTAVSQTSVSLLWSAPANVTVTNYTAEYGTTRGDYTTHISEGTALGATVPGLTSNTTYWFEIVWWTNATQPGGSSNVVPANTLGYKLGNSVLLATDVSPNSVSLSWTAPANVTVVNYTVEFGTSPGNYPVHVSEGTALVATVSGLMTNTTYWFEIVWWTSPTVHGAPSNVVPITTKTSGSCTYQNSYWNGNCAANTCILTYPGVNGYPTTVPPGQEFSVLFPMWNRDSTAHNVTAVDVGSPFTWVGANVPIPTPIPAGYDDANFVFYVTAPSSPGASLTLTFTIAAA